jgi:hypothetical protein
VARNKWNAPRWMRTIAKRHAKRHAKRLAKRLAVRVVPPSMREQPALAHQQRRLLVVIARARLVQASRPALVHQQKRLLVVIARARLVQASRTAPARLLQRLRRKLVAQTARSLDANPDLFIVGIRAASAAFFLCLNRPRGALPSNLLDIDQALYSIEL